MLDSPQLGRGWWQHKGGVDTGFCDSRASERCMWYYQLALQEASVQGQYMNYLQVGARGQLL